MESGVVINNQFIGLEDDKIEAYLENWILSDEGLTSLYTAFRNAGGGKSFLKDFCVQILGYAIIKENTVYYPKGFKSAALDKVAYAQKGYKFERCNPKSYVDNKFVQTVDPIDKEIEMISFDHFISLENELAYWYPKVKELGFKTPETLIIECSEGELRALQDEQFPFTEEDLIARVTGSSVGESFINGEMFLRFGISSNKFNFATCHLFSLKDLYPALFRMSFDMAERLEWVNHLDIVLRSFIHPSYHRPTIYNGMPLNTEFRVFYDFDTCEFLGSANYWDQDTMLDNLYNQKDLQTFATVTSVLEDDYKRLLPILKKEAIEKLPHCSGLKGKWSIDFLYDGQDFVLIDMAHAECSCYYDSILRRQRAK